MNGVLYISDTRRDEIITDAARRQTPVVLTRRGPSGWSVAKARFLGLNKQEQRLLIEHPPGVDDRAWPAPLADELFGVAFRRGHKKCLFNAAVVDPDAGASVGVKGAGFALRWPGEVQELQRRVFQRASPPPGRRIQVRLWPGGSEPGREPALTGTLENLSAGGIRVSCSDDARLEIGQAVKTGFALGSRTGEVVVDSAFRHHEARANGGWSLGFQFVGLETSREGQELLLRIARVVTDFQRSAARRKPTNLRPGRRGR